MTEPIIIRSARLHNLKNISLSIPKNKLVVLTGVSGSGKSTLGLDILNKEGQRQYLESLGLIPYGMARPPVDEISGLSPSISVDQHLINRNPRSTVGTATDVYTYLRVLYARLGRKPCPACGETIQAGLGGYGSTWEDRSLLDADEVTKDELIHCPNCGAQVQVLGMADFSFNKPEGACPTCTGLGVVYQTDLEKIVDPEKSIMDGAVYNWNVHLIRHNTAVMKAAAANYGFVFDPSRPVKAFGEVQRDLLFFGVEDPRFGRHFPEVEPPSLVRQGRFEGVASNLLRRYAERVSAGKQTGRLQKYMIKGTCPDCQGTKLCPESREVTVHGLKIEGVVGLSLVELWDWMEKLEGQLKEEERVAASPILSQIRERVNRLIRAGAGYLSPDRSSETLSVGESQRLRLASLLGSALSGVLYVLDEPTIGTHARDTEHLITVLKQLRDLGNTVLVIEHDLAVIQAADYVIDLGPGGGVNGGQVVAVGTPEEIMKQTESVTGNYLAGRLSIPIPLNRHLPEKGTILLHGARQHNLKDITVRFPLGVLVAVTGVAGAGKSTLVFDVLEKAIRHSLQGKDGQQSLYRSIEGWEGIDQVVTIDQVPLHSRKGSNAATYTGIFTPIRELFSSLPEAQENAFSASTFSFNTPGGRCEHCQGTGIQAVQMYFMPDVVVPCPVCQGRRYKREVLAVTYQGYDIAMVLELTVEGALELFAAVPAVASRAQVLRDVGLGYLQLGQPTRTLSGGEAQRVKLAKELGRIITGHSLYLLDEPTTGLHQADVVRLQRVLQRLVAAGNSVVVVEHNLEMVRAADWVIDLGPEGGEAGGWVVAEGAPEVVAMVEESYTGKYLKLLLKD